MQRVVILFVLGLVLFTVVGLLLYNNQSKRKKSTSTTTLKPTKQAPKKVPKQEPEMHHCTFSSPIGDAHNIIQYPANPALPNEPSLSFDFFKDIRTFELRKKEGKYCAFWYGNWVTTSQEGTIQSLVGEIDRWYLTMQTQLGYSVHRSIHTQKTTKYKFNLYLRESGLGTTFNCRKTGDNCHFDECERYPMDHCIYAYLGSYPNITGIPEEGKGVHYILVSLSEHTIIHELGHLVQLRSGGFRDDPRVGWGWESNAEYMVYKVATIHNKTTIIGTMIRRAIEFLTDYYWRRMDSFLEGIQYKSWIWWQCLDVLYGSDFVGKMWSNVEYRQPQFEEVARMRTGGDVPTMFAQYVRCVMNLNLGTATSRISGMKTLWKSTMFPMPFERTTFLNDEINMETHRLQPFGFVVVDIGSGTRTNNSYKAKIVPLPEDKHPCEAWRGVHGQTILRAHEWSPPFTGKQVSALGVTCATRNVTYLDAPKDEVIVPAKFKVVLELVR